jgi:translation initiation factor IF-2
MAQSMKVFELAKELNLRALDLIDKVKPLDLKLKNHMADLSPDQVEKIRSFINPPEPEPKKKTSSRKKSSTSARSVVVKKTKAPTVLVKTAAVAASGTATAEASDGKPVMIRRNMIIRKDGTTAENAAGEMMGEGLNADELGAQNNALETLDEGSESLLASPEAQPLDNDIVAMEVASPDSEYSGNEAPSLEAAGQAESALAAATPNTTAPATPARRGPRYSIIRVVSAEPTAPKKPLIVEEAPAHPLPGQRPRTSAPKTFTDPELARTGSALIRESEIEEELRRKKQATTPRVKEEDLSFKSTDYLRRERVYQPKKKRISIGRISNKPQITTAAAHKRMVEFDTRISVENLAHQMAVKVHEVVKKLRQLGLEQPDEAEGYGDWYLDFEEAQLVSTEFDFELRDETFREDQVINSVLEEEIEKNLEPRSPVITIMGHVDHGKTSLLDIIRRARVASGEAGGITQHIGAYTVNVEEAIRNLQSFSEDDGSKKDKKKDKKKEASAKKAGKGASATKGGHRLTFLDTPGHAAFTSMRSRGARITDVVILVVSAVDGVMPQTQEAIDHARAAGVPLIVAVNKMDLPEANPDRVKKQLGDLGILPEDWGGDTIFVDVSAKTGLGVDKLLEMIQLQAEILQLKARAVGMGDGAVIEARLDKGRGPLASVLVRNGEVKVGEYIVCGTQYGKIRALIDDKGKAIREAGPSTPIEILGLSGVPEAGDAVNVMPDEKSARSLAENRELQKKEEASNRGAMSLEDLYARMAMGDLKELPVLIKADVKGSGEAIAAALMKLPQDKVRLKLLSTAVGGISESDVLLASASKAIILGFNVRPDVKSETEAERRGVQIRTYNIIYDLIEDVTRAMEGLLDPTLRETVMGRAEVRNVFNISKIGTVAGCFVQKGKIQRSNMARLLRDGRVIYTGKISGLKRFKDDAREVAEGYECGISIEGYNDIKQGDVIEAFMVESQATKLSEGAGAQA